jgi:hypothetical protein
VARSIRPVLFGGGALVIVYLGQLALAADRRFDAALLLGGGVALFLLVLGRVAYFPETAFGLPRLPWAGWRQPPVLAGLALLAAALASGGWAAREFYVSEPTTSLAWLLHLASVALALAAAPLFDRALRTVDPGSAAPARRRRRCPPPGAAHRHRLAGYHSGGGRHLPPLSVRQPAARRLV